MGTAATACLFSPPPTGTGTGAAGAGASTPGTISVVAPSSKMSCFRGPLGASWKVTASCFFLPGAGSLPKI